jgi:hypothetical protein
MFFWLEYIFSITVLHLVFGAVPGMLKLSHSSPVFWSPAAQTADGDFIVPAPGFPSSTFPRTPVATPRAQVWYQSADFLRHSRMFTFPSACWAVVLFDLWYLWDITVLHGRHCVGGVPFDSG